jgi:hypothetical protein
MTVDSAARKRPGRFALWRDNRPFVAGVLMIVSGLLLLGSGNLDLGNMQIHLGVTGYLSYIVPAVLILCGALVWASPDQRMFYGIIAVLDALYSLISVNLGGFFVGMIVGIVGGSLAVAWDPLRFPFTDVANRSFGDPQPIAPDQNAYPDETWAEGKEGARFPGPRHAADPAPADEPVGADELNQTGDSRLRTPGFVITGFALIALIGSIGFITLHDPQPAAAAACTLPSITELRSQHSTPKVTKKTTVKQAAYGDGRLASGHTAADAGPLGGLVGGIIGVLTGGAPDPDPSGSPSPDPTPTDTPTVPATPDPTTAPPTEPPTTAPPTTGPKPPKPSASPTPSTGPTTGPTTEPTHPTGGGAPTPSPSASCQLVAKDLAPADGQRYVPAGPGTMTADTLTMTGLTYDGNVDLPTKSGTITVMQFSMDSSTSTPFELDVTTKGITSRTKSTKLTVSGNVKFYATEIKGNVLGVLPADYTPDNPPPIVPPVLFFTNVTIGLESVVCNTLTADSLTIN